MPLLLLLLLRVLLCANRCKDKLLLWLLVHHRHACRCLQDNRLAVVTGHACRLHGHHALLLLALEMVVSVGQRCSCRPACLGWWQAGVQGLHARHTQDQDPAADATLCQSAQLQLYKKADDMQPQDAQKDSGC